MSVYVIICDYMSLLVVIYRYVSLYCMLVCLDSVYTLEIIACILREVVNRERLCGTNAFDCSLVHWNFITL